MLQKEADNKTQTAYTAEELAEIQRIVNILPGSDSSSSDSEMMSLKEQPAKEESQQEEEIQELEIPETDEIEIPEDFGDVPEDIKGTLADELKDLDSLDMSPVEDIPEELSAESEIEDITSLIEEVELPTDEFDVSEKLFSEEEEVTAEEIPSFDAGPEEIEDLSGEISEISEERDEIQDIDLSGVELPPLDEVSEKSKTLARPDWNVPENSTLHKILKATEDVPEIIDDHEIAKDAFDPEKIGIIDQPIDQLEEEEKEGEFSDLENVLPEEEEISEEGPLKIESADLDIPDMDSLNIDETAEISEADLSEIPPMDIGDIPDLEIEKDESKTEDLPDILDESALDDLGGEVPEQEITGEDISDISGIETDEDFSKKPMEDMGIEDFGEEEVPDVEQKDEKTEDFSETEIEEEQYYGQSESNEPTDLSTEELRRLKKGLLLLPPGIVSAVKDAILKDRLSPSDTKALVKMIIDGRPEDNVHKFLEKKLNKKIEKDAITKKRRVVVSRPEYTKEGRERQKRLLRKTKILGIIGILVLTAMILSYQYIYKPVMAKHYIDEGVELIRRENDPKFPDYKEAEEIFDKVEKKFKKDYLYGYNSYGKAYFDRKEYYRALQKYNKAYEIDFRDVDTLNSLGFFYSRATDPKFIDFFEKSVKLNLDKYYFSKSPAINKKPETQLDLAIEFYRKALNIDPKNITSLMGIGNAYFYQGQFLKARSYYEEILKIDPDSVAGYSGLLNLFIEKDNFPEALKIFVDLRDKDILSEVPSALLGKLAEYFLSKSKSEGKNIRIDYGIQSSRLKDEDDNPFPAVRSVLESLMKRDSDYPPLYLHYANLALKEKNLKLMESYLTTALEKAKSKGQAFFEADHMMGEFLYHTKDPVRAYSYLKKAIEDLKNPPDFQFDEYYKLMVNSGRTYALMGNVFYYFFDKIEYKTGDQESVAEGDIDNEEEKLANFNIARNKYEAALKEGFESTELHYNLGRIYYLNKSYEQARDQWLNLYDSFTTSPEMMFSLGNVFYKLGNLDSARAQYVKLLSVYEFEADKVKRVVLSDDKHIKLFQTLSSVYNNLGAVYIKQQKMSESSVSFWKSIDYATRINKESEFARVNLAVSLKEKAEMEPIVDDNIPYSIEIFKEEMR